MISLKKAEIKDITLIYELAEEIWNKHYIHIITQQQIDYMLGKFYSREAMEKAMENGELFYLVKDENKGIIGYLSVTEKEKGIWFMNKYYLRQKNQRSGIGSFALKLWEKMASPQILRLQVNRQNYKSVNFYFKNGFTIEETGDFDIGNGFTMDDFIMVKKYTTNV